MRKEIARKDSIIARLIKQSNYNSNNNNKINVNCMWN